MEVLGEKYIPSKLTINQQHLQDLKDYFARPRLLSSGVLPTNNRSRIFGHSVTMNALLTSNFPNGQARLTGVYGLRFSVVYTLQVAATPFHQGVLALGWQYDVPGIPLDTYNRGERSETVTNLPHVRLDLSSDTMVTLKVPFLSFVEFLPILDPNFQGFDYGSASLNYILPTYTVAGITSPTYKLYIHLEDLEFYGADNAVSNNITLQSGSSGPVEEEASKVSTVVSKVSSAVKMFRGVPLISSYASTASWFLDAVAGTARAFGYSKPVITKEMMRVNRFATAMEHNVDLPTNCAVLSAFASNRLEASPTFGATDVDEMAFSFVMRQYSQICVGNIGPELTHGSAVYGTRVSPMCFWFRAPAGAPYGNLEPPTNSGATANAFQPSGVFYWSQMFRQWHGGFVFRFTFGKTKHHAGRVMVNFNPQFEGYRPGTGTVNVINGPEITSSLMQPFGYNAIFDLKDGNTFEFKVPYMSPMPYLSFYSYLGSLSMSIMDPLQSPSVVTSTIPFLVEVKADDDYEVALPRSIPYPAHPRGTIRLQAGKDLVSVNQQVSSVTVGEKFNSVKQLIMLPKWSNAVAGGGAVATMTIFPWYYHNNPPDTVPFSNTTTLAEAFSYAGNAACCYIFAKGGTDFHAYHNRAELVNSHLDYLPPDGGISATTNSFPSWGSGSSQIRIAHSNGAPIHAKIPANQLYERISTYFLNNKGWNLYWNANRNIVIGTIGFLPNILAQPVYTLLNGSGAAVNFYLSRAASDDAALASYVGPPPCALPSAGATVPWDADIANTLV